MADLTVSEQLLAAARRYQDAMQNDHGGDAELARSRPEVLRLWSELESKAEDILDVIRNAHTPEECQRADRVKKFYSDLGQIMWSARSQTGVDAMKAMRAGIARMKKQIERAFADNPKLGAAEGGPRTQEVASTMDPTAASQEPLAAERA